MPWARIHGNIDGSNPSTDLDKGVQDCKENGMRASYVIRFFDTKGAETSSSLSIWTLDEAKEYAVAISCGQRYTIEPFGLETTENKIRRMGCKTYGRPIRERCVRCGQMRDC